MILKPRHKLRFIEHSGIWELDRLGRSLKHLIDVVEGLKTKDINFQVLKDAISTDTIGGELTFHIFGALAEFERKLIVQRTRDSLAAAFRQGQVGWQTQENGLGTDSASRHHTKL